MLLLNFAHPLSDAQLAALEALLKVRPEVRLIPVQLDQAQALEPQVDRLADAAGLDAAAWQTTALIVNPPGLAPVAAALLAAIHGRAGHFPALLRLRPQPGSTPTVYELAEIINLQQLRERARERR